MEQFPESICTRCGQLIRRSWAVRVGDRLFHKSCAFMSYKDLFDKSGQSILCCECHGKVTGPKFKRVGERIYHTNCLKCAGCEKPFDEGTCYQVNDNNYCRPCHWVERMNGLAQTDSPGDMDIE